MGHQSCRVLVVDDEPRLRQLLVELLTDEGYEVRVAANGRQALTLLDYWRPDLIVSDLAMPVMDGWTFRGEQLRSKELAEIPLVIYSARPNLGQQAQQLGAAAFVPKDGDLDELVAAVGHLS